MIPSLVSTPGGAAGTTGWSILGVLKWMFALIAAQWMTLPDLIRTLVVLMAMDYIGGVVVAALDGKMCARVGWHGLIKKVATLTLLLTLNIASRHTGFVGIESVCGLGFLINEMISLMRKFAAMGVPIPPALMAGLNAAKAVRVSKEEPKKKP